jgi:hypothetical protein
MAKIVLSVFDALPQEMAYASDDETADSDVITRIAFDGHRGPIPMRVHDLPAGSVVEWRNSRTGHLIYVWSGSAVLTGEELVQGSTVIVEHRASTRLEGGPGGCTLLVFNPAAGASGEKRAGGNVHILPAAQTPRTDDFTGDGKFGAAMYADSTCPTCTMWMHENGYHQEGYVVEPHYHSEDEIIVVTSGEIILGQRRYGRGTAISIAGKTIYTFRTGTGGLAYINFRSSHPSYAPAGATETVDELIYYTSLGKPPYHSPHGLAGQCAATADRS